MDILQIWFINVALFNFILFYFKPPGSTARPSAKCWAATETNKKHFFLKILPVAQQPQETLESRGQGTTSNLRAREELKGLGLDLSQTRSTRHLRN